MSALAIAGHVPGTVFRWAMNHSQQVIRSARLLNEVRCLADLCRCLDHADEGHVFHPPFLVIKGRVAGRSRLFAARLTPAEVEEFRRGITLPRAAGEFVRATRSRWRRALGAVVPPWRRVTARELPPAVTEKP
jgi:hypothetical protein